MTPSLVECTRLHASLSLEACVERHEAVLEHADTPKARMRWIRYAMCARCETGAERLVQLRAREKA